MDIVNGPGEAREADLALCGGDGVFALYQKGQHLTTLPANDAVARLLQLIESEAFSCTHP